MKKKSSTRTSKTKPERDPMMPVAFPMTFDRWLKQPFMCYYTTLQAAGGKFDKTTRFFKLNENEMQEFTTSTPKGKATRKTGRKTSRRSDRDALIEKYKSDDLFTEAFRRCQARDAEMTAVLGNQMVRHCEHLFLLAEAGNSVAAKYLAELAVKATKGLERVVGNHYDELQSVAAIEYAWPLMISPVKTLSSAPPDWVKLGLGAALNEDLLNENKMRRLDLATPSGRLAWKLVNYIANLKYYHAAVRGQDDGARTNSYSLEQQAAALPKLTKDSLVVSKWLAVAERCLIESYPSPQDKNIFDEKNAVFEGIAPEQDQRTPDRHRNRIVERLSGSFDSIAGFKRVKKLSQS